MTVSFRLTVVAALCLAFSAAAGPVEEVRDAETAFAKAFADRDSARFFSFVLDDAQFLGGRTLNGKKAVTERWSRFFEPRVAPFSWAPERVVVNAAGTIGLSIGPVFDADGHHLSNYSSVWVKQPAGGWKVLFDGPGDSPACLAADAAPYSEGDIATPDGAKLHFQKIGDSPTVLIVPLGFLLYEDFKQLAEVATVIAYDPRDRGRSSSATDENTLTIQQDVKDLETVRAHFNVDKFVPVGFSYLGLMVAMYAAEHPERVARIVQLGPVPRKSGTQYPKELTNGDGDLAAPEADIRKWQAQRANPSPEMSQHDACLVAEAVLRYVLVGNGANAGRVRSSCELENEWPEHLESHFRHSLKSIAGVDFSAADLARLTMPVLTIHGTKDRNAPYGSGREWAQSLPNARLLTVTGAAHASWIDDPARVFAAIRAFVRGDWPLAAESLKEQ
jgi:pimeloyl-ACP methyl ester carboxylesterase/ketosteroid isomerase-like protein